MAHTIDFPQGEQKGVEEYDSKQRVPLLVKEADDDGSFVGYASVFGKRDLQDDVVEHGAFARTIKQKGTFPLLRGHVHDNIIGQVAEAEEDRKGLKIRGRLALGVQLARETYELVKEGILTGLSIGYKTVKDELNHDTGVRHLKEVELWEVSVVTFPACVPARISRVKSVYQNLPLADEGQPWDAEAAAKRVRAFTESEEKPSGEYRRAFLWVDKGVADEFSSYELPIADVVDGKLVAVPRGIFAAAAAIQGARGGVKIPENDRAAIRNHLGRYYKRLDRTPPWEGAASWEDQIRGVADLLDHCGAKQLKDLHTAVSKSNPRSDNEPFDWLYEPTREPDPTDANVLELWSWAMDQERK